MEILIQLESSFYSDEQNQYCRDNMIKIDWDLPFLPNSNDLFDCDSIIGDKMPDFDIGLIWDVECVNYKRIDGQIIPIL